LVGHGFLSGQNDAAAEKALTAGLREKELGIMAPGVDSTVGPDGGAIRRR